MMLKKEFSSNSPRPYESLCDLNLYFLWSDKDSSDWSLTIKEECLATLNQPVEEEKSSSNVGVTLLGVLVTLALLGAATWYQAPKIVQSYQEVADTVSTELSILMAY
ncbi:MAG: hypothetical protein AB4426_18800 [Xenococcaceae cyanobacterium]